MAWVLDLDGVLWLGDQPLAGAAGAVASLRAAGHRVLFVTNNSNAPVAGVEAKLDAHGVPAAGDVLTSALAAARLIDPGRRVLACAGPGVRAALAERGAVVVSHDEVLDGARVDDVVVGLHLDFDYPRLRAAAVAVRDGARLVGTNDDTTYPTPTGPIPGGGAILAAVVAATGVTPLVAGKPHEPMAALTREVLGDDEPRWMVGDRPSTDGAFARRLGARFGLVLTGVTAGDAGALDPAPDAVAADLAALVRSQVASGAA